MSAEATLLMDDEVRRKPNDDEIIGERAAVKDVLREVEVVAPTEATVLLQRETCTGKERLARAVILSPGPVLRLSLAELTPPSRNVTSQGRTLAEVDHEHIVKTLRDTHGGSGAHRALPHAWESSAPP